MKTNDRASSESKLRNAPASRRGKTGDVCEQSGCYRFDGYHDSAPNHVPTLPETEVYIQEGETFPPVSSTWKACWWTLVGTEECHSNEPSDAHPPAEIGHSPTWRHDE